MSDRERTIHLFIFRHGETDWNKDGRLQGWRDVPLNEQGRLQARQLADILVPLGIEFLISSDLSRAKETAEIVAERLKVSIGTTKSLREIHFGESEGRLGHDVWAQNGSHFRKTWREFSCREDWEIRMPGGESKLEAARRAKHGICSIIEANGYQRIGISTHGALLRCLAHHSMTEVQQPIPIPNCAVYELKLELTKERWQFIGPLFEQ